MFGFMVYFLLILCVVLPLYWIAGARANARPWLFLVGGILASLLGFALQAFVLQAASLFQKLSIPVDGLDSAGVLVGVLCQALAGGLLGVAVTTRAKILHRRESGILSNKVDDADKLLKNLLSKLESAVKFTSQDPGDMAINQSERNKLFQSSLRTMEKLDDLRDALGRISL